MLQVRACEAKGAKSGQGGLDREGHESKLVDQYQSGPQEAQVFAEDNTKRQQEV